MHNMTFEQIVSNLKIALDIVEDCGQAYRNASDSIKKLMNQAIFEKFYISNGPEGEFSANYSFKAPYTSILAPFKEDISKINTALKTNPEKTEKILEKAKGHIQEFLECGLSDVDNPSNISTYSNDSNFFKPNSSSKAFLVEVRGVEPLSRNRLSRLSTSVVDVL